MTEWTWMPTEHLHSLDHHACSSPRTEIKLSPAIANRQAIQHKRKRSESREIVSKKLKRDAAVEHFDQAVETRPPFVADRSTSSTDGASQIVLDSRGIKDDRKDSVLTQSGTLAGQPHGDADNIHAVPPLEASQPHDSCLIDPPRLSVTQPVTSLPLASPVSDTVLQNRTIDRIESELNLQILSKHNELRLIETEIGKAQIMLEQLRRVRIIPYPGHMSSPISVDNTVTGDGPAMKSEPGMSQPQHAPAFGSTDGPYSRHYERWLIPDEAFDPSPARESRKITSGPTPVMRKKSSLDDQIPARQPKRVSTSQIVQLPTPTISIDGIPLLVVQREDGEWVKIVCKICGKLDAANLQGFTNHTRIGHTMTYRNHKEAIRECGQPLDDYEAAQVSSATSAQASAAPSLPSSAMQPRSGRTSIHPLILGDSTRQSKSAQRIVNNLNDSDWRSSLPATPTSATPPVSATSSSFIASPDTPHLSRKLAALGSNINLHQFVMSSKVRIDLDQVQPLSPDLESPATPASGTATQSTISGTGQSRMPAREEASAAAQAAEPVTNIQHALVGQPLASRGPPHPLNTHRFGDVVPASFSSEASAITSASFDFAEVNDVSRAQNGRDLEMDDFSANHSPITVDTNPGLVSDHEDDSDYMHHSEHGDDVERTREDAFMHVRVRGEHGDEDEIMHDYHEVHAGTHCTDSAPYANSVFFTDEQRIAPHHQIAPPPSQKKKRGRPRKTDYLAPPSN